MDSKKDNSVTPLLGLSPDAAAIKPKAAAPHGSAAARDAPVAETGGPKGLEPTRYGDWEKKGRCSDF